MKFYWKNVVARVLPTMRILEEDWAGRKVVMISKEPKRGETVPVKIDAKTVAAFGEDAVANIYGGTSQHNPNFDGEDVQYESLRIEMTNVAFPKMPD